MKYLKEIAIHHCLFSNNKELKNAALAALNTTDKSFKEDYLYFYNLSNKKSKKKLSKCRN